MSLRPAWSIERIARATTKNPVSKNQKRKHRSLSNFKVRNLGEKKKIEFLLTIRNSVWFQC